MGQRVFLWPEGSTENVFRDSITVCKNEDNCKRGAIVFAHGAYQGAWCWKEFFMPYFSRIGYDCYALSLRGAREK